MKVIEWRDATVLIREGLSSQGTETSRECTNYVQVAEAIRRGITREPGAVRVAVAMGIALGIWKSPALTLDELDVEFSAICGLVGAGRVTDDNVACSVEEMESAYRRFRAHGLLQVRIALVVEALVLASECFPEPAVFEEPGPSAGRFYGAPAVSSIHGPALPGPARGSLPNLFAVPGLAPVRRRCRNTRHPRFCVGVTRVRLSPS